MRGIGRVTVRSTATCNTRPLRSAKSRPSTAYHQQMPTAGSRSIYTSSNARPYGFGLDAEARRSNQYQSSSSRIVAQAQQQEQEQYQHNRKYEPQGPQHGSNQLSNSTGFLPVPFVTEQLAGAHHSTDLFSRLLKERIVAGVGFKANNIVLTRTLTLPVRPR